ncbi:MAG TPA: polyhydroxyalkanoic acid system family protein [Candidatus Acidoferrum sp.]|nr:polyhydroxyalkanoic acid system family protein [Candidatus Acidoferrum sp.]
MKFDHPHSLAKEDARTRLLKLGQYLTNRHGIQVAWNGDTGRFRGKYLVVAIEGELVLGDRVVHVIGKDPGLLWRRRASDYLKSKLETYLDPARPVDELPTGR